MSNERIDLTQFEGISEGSWEVRPRSRYKIATEEHYVAQVMNNRGGDLEPVAEANANAIAKLPNLIAELKRCYEEIDNLLKQENRLIEIAVRCGAWERVTDFSDIDEKYGASHGCGSIPSGCCEDASQ